MPLTPELRKLLEEKGIVGVSNEVGRVRVYVETPEDAEKLLLEMPEIKIAGISYKVEPIVSGKFIALQKSRIRPILGGISCGNQYITAGTLSLILRDKSTNELKILSNNHVLTRIALGEEGRIGDNILQPGPYDGGRVPEDIVGHLERFVSIKLPPETNLVDAALATVEVDSLPYEIMNIGTVKGTTEAREGMKVKKMGRTTGVTRGEIFDTSAAVRVFGYYGTYAIFEDQLIISPAIAAGGDSGSILLTEDNKIVGLIFAGSSELTVANKISHVIRLLNIDVPVVADILPEIGLMIPLAFVLTEEHK